jgi:hypothetical protein
MRGLRVQALFRATLVALGQFRLLTDEDAGEPYYDDRMGRIAPPDFRVVDRDGETMLVEVKSVRPRDPLGPYRTRASDVDAWRRWGELTGAPVALALFWVSANQWTLVDIERLRQRGAKYEISLGEAMAANAMGRFGDCLLGTRPPLILRLHVEQLVAPDPHAHSAEVRITKTDILASGRVLRDELERKIAWYFMNWSGWEVEQRLTRGPAGRLVTVDLVSRPSSEALEAVAEQGFACVGMLSSLYAALFNEATLSRQGEVDELVHRPEPGELAALIPHDYWDGADRALPLWRLNLEPVDPAQVTLH